MKVLKIDDPHNKVTGFLSNASAYGFFLEGKWWPTVEHYLHAKKFEGTQFEEEIRLTPTVFRARKLSQEHPRIFSTDGGIIQQRVCGRQNSTYMIRPDWKKVEARYLEAALRTKFSSPKLVEHLLSTDGFRLLDLRYPRSGYILEKIREENLPQRRGVIEEKIHIDYKDVPSKQERLVDKIIERIKKVISLVCVVDGIAKTEFLGEKIAKQFPSGVMEDALSNMCSERVMKRLRGWLGNVQWTDVYVKMPEYGKLKRLLKNVFENENSATLAATFIRWFLLEATDSERKYALRRIKEDDIVLPPIPRSYRKVSHIVIKKADKLKRVEKVKTDLAKSIDNKSQDNQSDSPANSNNNVATQSEVDTQPREIESNTVDASTNNVVQDSNTIDTTPEEEYDTNVGNEDVDVCEDTTLGGDEDYEKFKKQAKIILMYDELFSSCNFSSEDKEKIIEKLEKKRINDEEIFQHYLKLKPKERENELKIFVVKKIKK